MGLLDQMTLPATAVEVLDQIDETQATAIGRELDGANLTIEHLQESIADLELMLEDRGWTRLGMWADQQFSREGLGRAALLCRAMAIANPLIRRALSLRSSYVWGGGVTIQARAKGGTDGEQNVNQVIQDWITDRDVRKFLTSAPARETNERTLGTDGNLIVALWTSPLTGRVIPRLIPLEEIRKKIKNPEDRTEVWFYQRISIGPDGQQRITYHPDIDYRPRGSRLQFRRARNSADLSRSDAYKLGDQTMEPGEILWDAPIAHQKVNALADWDFGIGDAFAAIAWARAYKEFLEDWAKLVKALSRFAWRVTSGKRGAAQAAADRIGARTTTTVAGEAGRTPVGQTASMVGADLEAIPKTGATIDSNSGKPLAGMVAAATDVPVTMLLGDPGITGARATAETLDTPTENMAGMRRETHSEFLNQILNYVIDSSVRAPQGVLKGTVSWDEWDRQVITLDGNTERTIEIVWPDLTDTPVDVFMKAIEAADGLDKLPPLEIVKLVLAAFKVKDPDEVIAQVTDDSGEFVAPSLNAGQVAVDRHNRGEPPAL